MARQVTYAPNLNRADSRLMWALTSGDVKKPAVY
jgi:hypothetical protein